MCRHLAGGCLIGAALVCYGVIGIVLGQPPSHSVTRSPYEQPQQEASRAQPPRAPAPAPQEPERRAYSADYERACDHPEGPEEADLCQQWRMAKASEELADLAARQFWATVVEISALGLVLIFTAWAAIAAQKSAHAAAASVSVTREIGQAQVRCYPSIQNVEIGIGGDSHPTVIIPAEQADPADTNPTSPTIFFEIENFGQSPLLDFNWRPSIKYMATFFRDGISSAERQSVRSFPASDYVNMTWGASIPAGERKRFDALFGFSLNRVEKAAAITHPPDKGVLVVTLVISISYRDVFSNTYTDDIAFAGAASKYRMGDRIKMRPVPIYGFEAQEELRRRHEESERDKQETA